MISEHRIADQTGGTYGSSEAAAGWQRSGVARARILAPLTERMLDLAGVDIGHRVLDVAAGTGEQTLLAAQRVGPTGAVLATDIAARMLALAEEAVARVGLENVETRVLDARDLNLEPESFDAAIARLALMLVPERARVMAGIHQALKPGTFRPFDIATDYRLYVDGKPPTMAFATFSHHAVSGSPREVRMTPRRPKPSTGSATVRMSWSTKSSKTKG